MFVFSVFIIAEHIDYFSTRELTSGTVISVKEKNVKDGMLITFEYFDKYKSTLSDCSIAIPYRLAENVNQNKTIDIFYTRYFHQVLIKGYKNPFKMIFLIDLIMIILFHFGIRAGLNGLKRRSNFN